jgi:N6-L-threonylcarbamoyladenine synthase
MTAPRGLVLGVEVTFNNCCVSLLTPERTVVYETNQVFRPSPGVVQDTPGWSAELAAFHARTLPGIVAAALAAAPADVPVTLCCLSVVSGKLNRYVEVARPIVSETALRCGARLIEVDHHEAHLMIALLCQPDLQFPYIGLTVAGGHCHLSLVRGVGDYQLLGSHDSAPRNRFGHGRAPGAVLDRCADLLGLVPAGQPDGAIAIDTLSQRVTARPRGFAITAQANSANGYDFDFHALYEEVAHALDEPGTYRGELASAAQEQVMTILVDKAFAAAAEWAAHGVCLGGGVAANSRLRKLVLDRAAADGRWVCVPPPQLCVDNARMIAFAGMLRSGVTAEGDAECVF